MSTLNEYILSAAEALPEGGLLSPKEFLHCQPCGGGSDVLPVGPRGTPPARGEAPTHVRSMDDLAYAPHRQSPSLKPLNRPVASWL